MKVWLYYRLSRDEDEELNSLTNQRKIIYDYAVAQGHEIVGESFDDNVSGMHFNREGIERIYEAVEADRIEAVIVKDLSRLGRHRTQTALFIDYLREHNVRVLSATENIDTFNENDDLIIGFKGLVNDFYARDGIRKKNIWEATMVSRILQDEFYAGTLICHKSERNKINKTFRFTGPDEQFRHENFVPAIVTKEIWQQVQALIAQRKEGRARAAPGKKLLRYGGLLRCEDCGRTFVGKHIRLKSRDRVEYICDTYHRYGREHCTSHAIREELLDQLIIDELRDIRLMDSILAEGAISEANLRLLVDKIYIAERNGKLDVDIHLKAPFQTHGLVYENGEVTEAWGSQDYDWDRLGAILMEDFWKGDGNGGNEGVAVLPAV